MGMKTHPWNTGMSQMPNKVLKSVFFGPSRRNQTWLFWQFTLFARTCLRKGVTQIFRGCPVILPGLVARQDRFLFFFHEAIQGCRKFVADGASWKEIVPKS